MEQQPTGGLDAAEIFVAQAVHGIRASTIAVCGVKKYVIYVYGFSAFSTPALLFSLSLAELVSQAEAAEAIAESKSLRQALVEAARLRDLATEEVRQN